MKLPNQATISEIDDIYDVILNTDGDYSLANVRYLREDFVMETLDRYMLSDDDSLRYIKGVLSEIKRELQKAEPSSPKEEK